MLIPITYIDSKYSETGEAKLNESLSDDVELTAEEKEKREEKLRQREIDRIIGKVDEEEEFLHKEPEIEFRIIEFQDDDFIFTERKACIDTEEVSYAHETEQGYTSILTKGNNTILIKESVDYLLKLK